MTTYRYKFVLSKDKLGYPYAIIRERVYDSGQTVFDQTVDYATSFDEANEVVERFNATID